MNKLPKPYYARDGITLYNDECLDVLWRLGRSGEKFDGLVTDPPYASGGLHVGAKSAPTNKKYQQRETVKRHPDFGGDARDQLSWVHWCGIWINLCRKMLTPGAPVLMFCDWRQVGAAITSLQAGGIIYRGLIVWDKKNGRPAPGRFRAQCEYVLFGSNGAMPPRDLYLPGVFQHATVSGAGRMHASQKPIALMKDLLQIIPAGGRVLDPFAGSGSTLIAADETGRKSVGIEESTEISQLLVSRIELKGIAA